MPVSTDPEVIMNINYTTAIQTRPVSSSAELLNWCIDVTSNYPTVNITNWTTSWRNGLAFCAIIHHFRPDLITYELLEASNIYVNNSLAFAAAESIGVPRILDAKDMELFSIADKLNIMTYVYQLRARLTGCCSQLSSGSPPVHLMHQSLSPTALEPATITTDFCPLSTSDKLQNSLQKSAVHNEKQCASNEISNTETHTKLLSPFTRDDGGSYYKHSTVASMPVHPPLMTRQQLVNPFDSDSDEEKLESDKTSTGSPCQQTDVQFPSDSYVSVPLHASLSPITIAISRTKSPMPSVHMFTNRTSQSELQLQSKSASPGVCANGLQIASSSVLSAEVPPPEFVTSHNVSLCSTHAVNEPTLLPRRSLQSRREQLHERARLMLQQARRDVISPAASSAQHQVDECRQKQLHERARQLIAKSFKNAAGTATEVITVHAISSYTSDFSVKQSIKGEWTSARELTCSYELQNSGDKNEPVDILPINYTECEISFLERSLKRLDERTAGIEWSLRRCMLPGANKDNEEQLTSEWFALVDERNELVRRIEQLNTLVFEQDLERRFELLSIELRRTMIRPDLQDEEKRLHEQLLLAELVSIVNQRDELVQRLDAQEQEIQPKIGTNSELVATNYKQQCLVQ